jgi:anti-sigma factor RsiW
MSCEKAESLLHGYLDGELDAVRAVEFERHARDCPVCTRELDAQQSLRAHLRDADLYAPAPPPCAGPSASGSSQPRAKARHQPRVPDAGGGWRPPPWSRCW